MIIDGIDLPFTYVCGSKEWPSNDPNDSPYSKYVCNLCEGEIKFKEFGEFSFYEIMLGGSLERVLERVKWHYGHCPKKEIK